MCRYPTLKHNEAFFRLEEDVWHVIIGMARRGVTFMDEALPYVVNMWQAKGLLSDGYCNMITTELNDWAAGWKRTKEGPLVARQVFLAALKLANRGGPLHVEDESVVSAPDEKWLERLIEEETAKLCDDGRSQTPAPQAESSKESGAELRHDGENKEGGEDSEGVADGASGEGGASGEDGAGGNGGDGGQEHDGDERETELEADGQQNSRENRFRASQRLKQPQNKKRPREEATSPLRKGTRRRTHKKYEEEVVEVKGEKHSPVYDLDELKVIWEGREEV